MIPFRKMHGAGNDFLVFDNRDGRLPLATVIERAPVWCDRRTGVGADGVLLLETAADADFHMVYRNADGSDAGMCGNGGRCLARFAHAMGLPARLTFTCNGRRYRATVAADSVELAFPVEVAVKAVADGWRIDTGTDHLVCDRTHRSAADVDLLAEGRALRLTHNANVNFVRHVGAGQLLLDTYERGVEDLTLACGTGALAVSVWHHHRFTPQASAFSLAVDCRGGRLHTRGRFHADTGRYADLVLTGPAVSVFDGTLPA